MTLMTSRARIAALADASGGSIFGKMKSAPPPARPHVANIPGESRAAARGQRPLLPAGGRPTRGQRARAARALTQGATA
ncbi:hypothetical protein SAMN04488245_112139 [Alloyangia pacifica]|uniref:Uncharacterized protein n=1 Tax=Alloyangia pacifica TaxID=311180 RepID=A0A1I6VQU5_9RHOB|nr:hypothetical protein SAMN04488245_112139 [Alloyangia pacifica]SFT16092.1 hypothetical protein SAMN04488050_112139 [Alloyangia pacifica]